MAIITILAALLLPALRQAQARARRISCVDHLHELGIGFQAFAHDHNDRFPMAVPAAAGGALEFVQNAYNLNGEFYFSFRQFQALSNELVTPKLLVCPADTREPALNFGLLQNSNVSYFVGVSAEYAQPNSLLAGDGNLTNDWVGRSTFLRLGPGSAAHWTRELHEFKGNLLFADGRVVERRTPGLEWQNSAHVTADLLLPSIKSPGSAPATTALSPSGPPAPGRAPVQNQSTTIEMPSATEAQLQPPAETNRGIDGALTSPQRGPASNSLAASPLPAAAADEPGFSLFPPWVSKSAKFMAVGTGLPWYLALLLLALGVVWLRRRLQPAKRQRVRSRMQR